MGYPVYKLLRAINRQYPNNGFINEVDVNELSEGEGRLITEDLRDLLNEAIQETYIDIARDEVFSFPTVPGQNEYVLPEDCDLRDIQEVTRTFGGAFRPIVPGGPGPDSIATISFNSNGGSGTMPNVRIMYGETFIVPQCEFEYGTPFEYWRDQDSNVLVPGQEITVYGDIELKAIWSITTWRATFVANGGTGTMPSIVVNDREYIILPECTFTAPTDKYFLTWQDSDGALHEPGYAYRMTKNQEFKALWTSEVITHYTATFDPGQGTGTPFTKTSHTHPSEYEYVTIPLCTFVPPTGKHFENWLDSNSNIYNPGDVYEMEQDETFTAQYTLVEYKVTIRNVSDAPMVLHYDLSSTTLNGGEQYQFTVQEGETLGDTYTSVYLDGSYGDTFVVPTDVTVTSDLLYEYDQSQAEPVDPGRDPEPVWERDVKFYIDTRKGRYKEGGSSPYVRTVQQGSKVGLPPIVYGEDGYDFLGWSADGVKIILRTKIRDTIVNEDLTYYGIFEEEDVNPAPVWEDDDEGTNWTIGADPEDPGRDPEPVWE